MALNFDTRTAPRNHAEYRKLALAVRGATKADETLWLEWKSELDLDPADKSDKSGRAHIARAIIGFANRMPDTASRYVEGYGFLLAGVSHENMNGVKQHDITELVRWIQPYVGEEIRWQPTYVEIDQGEGPVAILVITIDPPRWGDPIYCMRKEAPSSSRDKSIPEAAIFVRRPDGTTSRARAADVDALSDRLVRRAPTLDLGLTLRRGSVLPITYLEEEALKPLAERQGQLGPVLRPPGETRSTAEYRAEVHRYLDGCRAKLSEAIDDTAAAVVDPVELRLINNTDTPLLSVQVVLQMPGGVRALEYEEGDEPGAEYFFRALPKLHPYGAGLRFLTPDLGNLRGIRSVHAGPSIRIDNTGPLVIHLPPVDLRPGQHVDLEPFVLIAPGTYVGGITAEWTATSTNMNGSLNGQLVINRDEPQSFLGLLTKQPTS
ncbi:hypothetical protein HCN51_56825 [Nonomuraea sp. FMUSA5-5]|uniref:ATP-binding protein n=1 Tax=Nonomuraea composti TaxID=2720023 RepID=A0ABX1BM18_9ACTN|nr:hypothetical protein [Nonomuraea sp. FMUSA5-5]NJP98790.1 hypothetical protein [Nonomuraea sp. FMUSA5-5]